jgi:hypothetical protein
MMRRLLLGAFLAGRARADLYYPQMIHLSLTGKDGEMAVEWISSCPDNTSSVTFADNPKHTGAATAPAVDHASAYEDLQMLHTNYTLHYALMTGLRPGTTYYYRVGCKEYSSEPLSFQSFPPAHREPIWAAYGDMGLGVDAWRELAPSIPVLAAEAQAGAFDGIIHAGDYAYDFAVDEGRIGDRFMNAIQPFASKVPYMGAVGNHECSGGNRRHYSRRFAGFHYAAENSNATPAGSFASGDNLWYSWDAGLIHFVTVNTEVWNCPDMNPEKGIGVGNCVWNPATNKSLAEEFLSWLDQDLETANVREQREKVPWIVMYAHKAFYMQPGTNFSAIDDLAHKYGVDLHIGGHVHIYQRFFPLRSSPYGQDASRPNNKPADWDHACATELPGGMGSVYTNPKYMTQIVAGSPGDIEITSDSNAAYPEGAAEPGTGPGSCAGLTPNVSIDKPIAACRANYGYGYLQATNKTHLHWRWKMSGVGTPSCKDPTNCTLMQERDVPPSQQHDELWIVKDKASNPVLGTHGKRHWDAPGLEERRRAAAAGEFDEWEPEEPLKTFYEMSKGEWQPDGCGELPLWQCDPALKATKCKNELLSPWQCGN